MADIILATLNARYAHASLGLRCLLANLGPLRSRASLLEFHIRQDLQNVAETILSQQPRIIGLGVYVWNAVQSRQLVELLKQRRPELIMVLGGPEVSHETDQQEICRLADHVIAGEGEKPFASLCRQLLGESGNDGELVFPYDLYTEDDIAHRVIYVEASRGCPFGCEFCLSSLDHRVRQLPLAPFLSAMQRLLDRGCRQFKFVDRTFNLDLATCAAILRFFLERYCPGMFLHFEMIPDRFPESLCGLVERFPHGSLQFEVGIQTFNKEVADRIHRRQDDAKVEVNLRWLRERTGVHIHADLIVGLPGENVESFADGFDRLVSLRPHEIQVGLLKRLRGAPIRRHDEEWQMIYASEPPYTILQNNLIDVATMKRLRRFARYWDLVANSGRFVPFVPLIWKSASPFWSFLQLSDWLYEQTGRTHEIALAQLVELLTRYLGQPVKATPGRDRQKRHQTSMN